MKRIPWKQWLPLVADRLVKVHKIDYDAVRPSLVWEEWWRQGVDPTTAAAYIADFIRS